MFVFICVLLVFFSEVFKYLKFFFGLKIGNEKGVVIFLVFFKVFFKINKEG